MMKIDVGPLFKNLKTTKPNELSRISGVNSSIGVFYGYHSGMNYRLAFMSSVEPPQLHSTASIRIFQWNESENIYWTCFDLIDSSAKTIFYKFGNDLIESVNANGNENVSLMAMKNRFFIWKKMFKSLKSQMSDESYKGLFGELYFIQERLILDYGVDETIKMWSGAESTNKDFSTGTNWFEVKTISSSRNAVAISSMEQLESDNDGKLVVVKTEKMSNQYDDGKCTVRQLINLIMNQIDDDSIKDMFVDKLVLYGFDEETTQNTTYKVVKINSYRVSGDFPRVTRNKIPYNAITKLSYELSLSAIDNYLED